MELIKQTAVEYCKDTLEGSSSFKVTAKRSDKKFSLKSPEICQEVGGYLLKNISGLKVDVHNPEVTVTVDEPNEEGVIIFHLHVAENDMGRVIGKKGKIANSIKTLIQAKAYNDGNKKVKVNIDSF
jgi:thiamine biosynthesis protein ThiI